MDIKELQKKNDTDLIEYVNEKRAELRSVRFAGAGTGARDPRAARNARREIAQTLTILNARARSVSEEASSDTNS